MATTEIQRDSSCCHHSVQGMYKQIGQNHPEVIPAMKRMRMYCLMKRLAVGIRRAAAIEKWLTGEVMWSLQPFQGFRVPLQNPDKAKLEHNNDGLTKLGQNVAALDAKVTEMCELLKPLLLATNSGKSLGPAQSLPPRPTNSANGLFGFGNQSSDLVA